MLMLKLSRIRAGVESERVAGSQESVKEGQWGPCCEKMRSFSNDGMYIVDDNFQRIQQMSFRS